MNGQLALKTEEPSFNEAGEPFAIHLEFFSGPMDLLLHLVQQREVSVKEVNLSEVCNQYLELVSKARWLDLERAGEFLVIAATLAAIKSSSLLPGGAAGEEELLEGSDPAFLEALRQRLIAYEETKKRAAALSARSQLGVNSFARPQPRDNSKDQEFAVGGEPHDLARLFSSVLKRIGQVASSMRITLEPVSVVSYMMKIVDHCRLQLKPGKRGVFRSMLAGLWQPPAGQVTESARGAVVGGFIALLELAKRGVISTMQRSDHDDIEVSFALESAPALQDGAAQFTSEFDEEFKPADELSAEEEQTEEMFEERREAVGGRGN